MPVKRPVQEVRLWVPGDRLETVLAVVTGVVALAVVTLLVVAVLVVF